MVKNTTPQDIALIKQDLSYMKKGMDRLEISVDEVKKNTETNFVTKAEFAPVKQIVYGIISLVVIAVFGALISLVVLK